MQPRYTSEYSDNLVNIINNLTRSINSETSSVTTSSLLHILSFAINEYEKHRSEDLQNLNAQRATQVTYAAHLYQRHFEKHLHRHFYSDEAEELSNALRVYEESIYDDIQTINLTIAQARANMMVQFLEAQSRLIEDVARRAALEKVMADKATALQQQYDGETESDFESTEVMELYPLLDDFDPEDPSIEWETSPLLFEDFKTEEDSGKSPINNSPVSPRFFSTPKLMLKNSDSEINCISGDEYSPPEQAIRSYNNSTDDEYATESPNPPRKSYFRI